MTSPTKGLGASCRRKISKYVHMTCEPSHIAKPKPIRAQNRLILGEDVLTLARNTMVAPRRTMFCRISPTAVRANPRCARRDNKTWAHTTAHTMTFHLRACWDADFPTLRF